MERPWVRSGDDYVVYIDDDYNARLSTVMQPEKGALHVPIQQNTAKEVATKLVPGAEIKMSVKQFACVQFSDWLLRRLFGRKRQPWPTKWLRSALFRNVDKNCKKRTFHTFTRKKTGAHTRSRAGCVHVRRSTYVLPDLRRTVRALTNPRSESQSSTRVLRRKQDDGESPILART
ncbi:MAG: hypothetical protein BJ554DRAFT_5639 [Olpidium bornovanus]|uniref:Uncharacterized protein n=1 Tax=Olpidium bornovanus TaxID=278681 RepID=A0A8H7ZZ78_9FUNG|nr:MAG: hypothetical protein BJ554DRAFT_5639 [Olpidium bornovanus]